MKPCFSNISPHTYGNISAIATNGNTTWKPRVSSRCFTRCCPIVIAKISSAISCPRRTFNSMKTNCWLWKPTNASSNYGIPLGIYPSLPMDICPKHSNVAFWSWSVFLTNPTIIAWNLSCSNGHAIVLFMVNTRVSLLPALWSPSVLSSF